MTKEQLEKAVNLKSQIVKLTEHLEHISEVKGTPIDYKDKRIEVSLGREYTTRGFIPEFYPVSLDSFASIYIMNVKAKIKELEKEFENL